LDQSLLEHQASQVHLGIQHQALVLTMCLVEVRTRPCLVSLSNQPPQALPLVSHHLQQQVLVSRYP
jgi:hypothetical protein